MHQNGKENMANSTSAGGIEPTGICDSSPGGTGGDVTGSSTGTDISASSGWVSAWDLASEIAFIDPAVDDIATILEGLRPEVEALILDREHPVSRQIADALAGKKDLDAVHVIAHGAPGRVSFAAGEWSAETLAGAADDLAAIRKALRPGGELCLWSCHAGRGDAGEAFINRLAELTGAPIAAAKGLVGATSRGGTWQLDHLTPALPPVTSQAVENYVGLLADIRRIVSGDVPHNPAEVVRYVVVNSRDKRVVATFSLPGHANIPKFAIPVIVPSATETYEAGRLDERGKFIPGNFTVSECSPLTGQINLGGTRHDG